MSIAARHEEYDQMLNEIERLRAESDNLATIIKRLRAELAKWKNLQMYAELQESNAKLRAALPTK